MGTPTSRATVLGCILRAAARAGAGRGLGPWQQPSSVELPCTSVACLRFGRTGGPLQAAPHAGGAWEAARMRGRGEGHRGALQHCLNHDRGIPCSSSAGGRGSRHGRPQAVCAGCRRAQVCWQWSTISPVASQARWWAQGASLTAGPSLRAPPPLLPPPQEPVQPVDAPVAAQRGLPQPAVARERGVRRAGPPAPLAAGGGALPAGHLAAVPAGAPGRPDWALQAAAAPPPVGRALVQSHGWMQAGSLRCHNCCSMRWCLSMCLLFGLANAAAG